MPDRPDSRSGSRESGYTRNPPVDAPPERQDQTVTRWKRALESKEIKGDARVKGTMERMMKDSYPKGGGQ